MNSQNVTLSADASNAKVLERDLDESVYSETVVLRAVHSLAPLLSGVVERPSPGRLRVVLRFCSSGLESTDQVWSRFEILLNDFLLRGLIEKETLSLRKLIVEQAFSRSNLLYPELDDSNPEQDPLGLGRPDAETGRRHD